MAVSEKMKNFSEKSSWIRKMFEEGARLKAEFGNDQVFDFSLGNPDVPPPPEFRKILMETAAEALPGQHAYMPNGGLPWVREAIAARMSDEQNVEVNPADIRVDTYRSSGAGGQHVNTTDSAVRITHIPTNIVVTSSEKSQHQNRDIAMKALKSRLYQQELDRRNAAINEAHEAKGDAGWCNQIRSYVLQPYQMVKDLRTNYETSDTKGVLDGDLDGFMAATLALDVAGKSRADAQAED